MIDISVYVLDLYAVGAAFFFYVFVRIFRVVFRRH